MPNRPTGHPAAGLTAKNVGLSLAELQITHLTKTNQHVRRPKIRRPFHSPRRNRFLRIIEKKAAAHYEGEWHPVDLVLYFEQQPPDRTAFGKTPFVRAPSP